MKLTFKSKLNDPQSISYALLDIGDYFSYTPPNQHPVKIYRKIDNIAGSAILCVATGVTSPSNFERCCYPVEVELTVYYP